LKDFKIPKADAQNKVYTTSKKYMKQMSLLKQSKAKKGGSVVVVGGGYIGLKIIIPMRASKIQRTF
jgi:threonine dehydrogenase-like Zn-dependent dehydrogenase